MAALNPEEMEAEIEALLTLALAGGIGALQARRLLEEHGSGLAVLREARRAGGEEGPLRALLSPPVRARVRRVRAAAEGAGMGILGWGLPFYPPRLAPLAEAPPVLFYQGDPKVLHQRAVAALVGTRTPTPYGRQATETLAGGLAARGVVVVSGLARGVDSHAHYSVLQAGGKTVAVLAGGLDRIYPPERVSMAEEIAREGLLLSEMPPGQNPLPGLFPRRNRILSGVSDLVVVVEAARKSGALITAQWALDQGKEVAAVPGSIFSPVSKGPFLLIRDGATPVDSVEAIMELLPPPSGKDHTPGSKKEKDHPSETEVLLTPLERAFLQALAHTGGDPEQAARLAGIPVKEALSLGVSLEMKGLARARGQGLLFPT